MDEHFYSRRHFLIQGAAALGAAGASPLLAQTATVQRRKVLHIIGHSHIDAAWLWPWRDGADAVLTTFRSALNRMKETPEFRYTHSSAQHYRWAQQADPAMFAEIRERILEGRWEVVGGWPVEPDCNIPAAESFVRHALYGKHYCQKELGAEVKIGFNPDSFGHAAGLPTILAGSGYGYYVFQRPQPHEMKLPPLFWWEGPDGQRVLVSRIWRTYDAEAVLIRQDLDTAFAPGFEHAVFYLGVGDHGGAVTRQQIAEIMEMRKDATLPELRFSTLREFFAAVEAEPAFATLPVVKGELQHHARGCYAAYGEGKILNRRAERGLLEAESLCLLGSLANKQTYPAEEFSTGWWKVLFNQFHDMMAGTALYADYQQVRDSVGYACEVAETAKVEAVERMARQVDLSAVREGALFLLNPLPWPRRARVELYTERNPEGQLEITHLRGQRGETLPIQWRHSASMTNFFPRLVAEVELPASGYKVFELAHGEAPATPPVTSRATVSETGFGLSSLKAEDGTELLAGPVGLVVIGDASDTWGHGVASFRSELGRPRLVSSTVVEDGPVVRVTRQQTVWQSSKIALDILQYADAETVELQFVIDWQEHEQMLMLEVPVAVSGAKIFAKVPGQVLERGVNGEEEPCQDWVAVEGAAAGGLCSLAVLNNSVHSYNCLGGLFRTTLIRSAPFARHNPATVPHNDTNAWQDQGRQERTLWLQARRGPALGLGLDRLAEQLQTPAESMVDSTHPGTEPWEKSMLEISPAGVWVMALKQAEERPGEVILRLQERTGQATEARLRSLLLGLDETVRLAPWEIKTLRIEPVKNGRAKTREVTLLEVQASQ